MTVSTHVSWASQCSIELKSVLSCFFHDIQIFWHVPVYVCIYIYIYICVCVCVGIICYIILLFFNLSHFFLFIDNNNVDLNYILTVELGFHFRNLVTLHIQAWRQVNQKDKFRCMRHNQRCSLMRRAPYWAFNLYWTQPIRNTSERGREKREQERERERKDRVVEGGQISCHAKVDEF